MSKLSRWTCQKCKEDFFSDWPAACPKCGIIIISPNVQRLMKLYGVSQIEADRAIAVQDAKNQPGTEYHRRYTQIRDGLGISDDAMFVTFVLHANRGEYTDDGVPAWDGAAGDELEQEECWNPDCGATFAPDPKREGQHLCPACESDEEDHYDRHNLIEQPSTNGVLR